MSTEPHSVRKSLFMSFRRCPKQGMYAWDQRDDSYGELNTTAPALLKGQIFHHAMEDLYNTMDVEKMKGLLGDNVREYIASLFPKTTQEDLVNWFNWYIDYETERFLKMRAEDKLQYFMPFKQEYYVEAEINGIKRTGHIDRIDRVGEKELMIGEYKTGMSYDPSKSWKLSDIRAELEWYRSIVIQLEEFKDYKVAGWKLINPTIGIEHIGNFAIVTKYSVDKNTAAIAEMLDGKREAEKKIGMQCNWCNYAKECLSYEDENHEIFGKLSKDMIHGK